MHTADASSSDQGINGARALYSSTVKGFQALFGDVIQSACGQVRYSRDRSSNQYILEQQTHASIRRWPHRRALSSPAELAKAALISCVKSCQSKLPLA